LYHNICIALENGQITVADFCDISKAFDRLWHKGLIEKLKSYGINGKLLKWLKDYNFRFIGFMFCRNEITIDSVFWGLKSTSHCFAQ
jgi:hypothetical protein